MCCLKYENDSYEKAREAFPETGSPVATPDGEGRVAGVNIFKNTISVELKESKIVKEYPLEEVITKGKQSKNPGGCDKDCPCQPGEEII
jgi:cell fate regulator YaaT (PSP1 superfamily)